VPVVAKTVSDSSRRAYGSYWKKIVDQWGERRLDEPTPSEVKELGEYIRATAVIRSNARGGTSAVENFITALTTPPSTPRYCGCTSRPPADAAAPSPYGRSTSTQASA
jgi:hypothetical protein